MKTDASNANVEILIVEDSATQAENLSYLLEKQGYRVATARNGKEGLETIRAHKPTLIITDINMPEMDGYKLCRRIRAEEHLADLPIILLTYLSDPEDVFRGLECGADNFISKPWEDEHLLARIQHLLSNHRLRKREKMQMGVEVIFSGHKHFITADRLRILNLLLSTYETAVQKNRALVAARDQLKDLNERLEERVRQRTADLQAEVTERRKAEEQVRTLNSDLEQRVRDRTAEIEAANKELEAFSYSVSHDLRAPLRSVDGFTKLLIENFSSQMPPEAQRLFNNVTTSARQMGQLIDDLLRFSHMSRQPLSKRPVNTLALVQEVVAELRKEQPDRRIKIQIGELPDCFGDRSLLRQVFVNLLSNAFKFTRQKNEAMIDVGWRREEGESVYFVRDNGAGFNMQYAQRLFGVFQRLHQADEFEGTGVGLSIVQRIIQRHGGRIRAEAAVNEGATFYFNLPGERMVSASIPP